QQAMADYVSERYATPETAFDRADTDQTGDTRIQNLDFREDTVLEGAQDDNSGSPGNDTPIEEPDITDPTVFEGAELFGTDENDIIVGSFLSDQLVGSGGDDQLIGLDQTASDLLGGFLFRVYNALFDRNPEADGLVDWLAQLRSGADPLALIETFLGSAEFNAAFAAFIASQPSPAPGESTDVSNSVFVSFLYSNLLARTPDAAGLGAWVTRLEGGESRASVAFDLINSAEAITTSRYANYPLASLANDDDGFALYQLYDAIFDRVPDRDGYLQWMNVIDAGTSNIDVANQLLSSGEFQTQHVGLSNSGLIELVYQQVLGRSPDQGGLIAWNAALEGGLSRGDLVVRIGTSAEAQGLGRPEFSTFLKGTMTAWNDRLDGGTGNDLLFGGRGADTFVFNENFGTDRIYGYEAGLDKIDLTALPGVETVSDLTLRENGGDVEIQVGNNTIILDAFKLSQFNPADLLL
ncbi:DUF4214 domain-containing protein, partial [Rhabdaerophilum sp. SD176]|uniref:DUF4214 domain-containing protein n=1 Tax=Rhabdaerophilum sp. SD176 TaxID=2983548 RepID=UPI0024DFA279